MRWLITASVCATLAIAGEITHLALVGARWRKPMPITIALVAAAIACAVLWRRRRPTAP